MGQFLSVALNGGKPVVSYRDFTNGDLKLASVANALVTGTQTVAGTFTVGSTVTYTVVLTNTGTGAMADNPGDELVDVLPSGLTLVGASASSGTSVANIGTNTVTWNGALAPSGTVTLTLTATINAAPFGSTIGNQATISYDADLNGTNETSTTTDDPSLPGTSDPTTFSVGGALLGATKTASGSFVAGGTVTYTIVISNSGPTPSGDNAGNELTDVLPSTLALTSATATSGTAVATIATNTVTWNGSIPGGGSVTITLGATVLPAAAGASVSNQATLAYDADLNGTNETTVVTDDPSTAAANDPTTFAATGAPGAPTGVTASAGNAQATVTFTAPASNGGAAITGYTVTSNPAGGVDGNAGTLGTSHVVTGLTNGVAYTFTVTATNAIGTSAPSAASNSVTPSNRSFSGPTATGSGTATVSFTGGGAACSFAPQGNGPMQSAFFIAVSGHAKSPPPGSAPSGIAFAHGLLDFVLIGCTPGSTTTFTVTYPAALAAATQYYKYGPTPGDTTAHWYVLPAAISGSTATFSITDGALGDDDLAANGTIVDQGGPGVGSAPPVQVPTLSEWAMVLMAMLLMLSAMTTTKRRARK